MITVLERARLVWTDLAAKFTECTWRLEASFLLNSLRIKNQFLERLQSVSVVDGAAHTQKDDVASNRGSLENVAESFALFLCSRVGRAIWGKFYFYLDLAVSCQFVSYS